MAYRTDTGDERIVTLAYPGEADISAGMVSILTPIGTALLGLKTGQPMSWTARDGRKPERIQTVEPVCVRPHIS